MIHLSICIIDKWMLGEFVTKNTDINFSYATYDLASHG